EDRVELSPRPRSRVARKLLRPKIDFSPVSVLYGVHDQRSHSVRVALALSVAFTLMAVDSRLSPSVGHRVPILLCTSEPVRLFPDCAHCTLLGIGLSHALQIFWWRSIRLSHFSKSSGILRAFSLLDLRRSLLAIRRRSLGRLTPQTL